MQCSFMIKCYSKLQIAGNSLNLLRGFYGKPITNLYLMVKKKKTTKYFPPMIEEKARIFTFHHYARGPSQCSKARKSNKWYICLNRRSKIV